MEERALYLRDGDGFVGTILTQGGWDPEAANGAAVLALLGHVLDDVPTLVPMSISRFTADLQRPVPIGRRMQVVPTVLREGKKIQVVQLQVLVDDVEHVRATALRLREAEVPAADVPPSTSESRPGDVLVAPDDARTFGQDSWQPPGFLESIEMRQAPTTDGSAPGCWVRLKVPVVAGEPVRQTSRLTYTFDCANLIGVPAHSMAVTMINPDVTAHVLRPPTGEWVAITGDTRFHPALGRGISHAQLSDDDGLFAVVSMSQLLQPRP